MDGLAIRLDKRIYTMKHGNKIGLTTLQQRVDASFVPYEKIANMWAKHTMLDPSIFVEDGRIWLAVPFSMPQPLHVENKILGIDIGVRRFVTTSEGVVHHPKDLLDAKRSLRFNKKKLQAAKDKSKSHSARTKLNKLSKKERHLNKAICHSVANAILKTDCNTIVLEELSSLKKNKLNKKKTDGTPNNKVFASTRSSKNRLSQVPIYLFQQILGYKALLQGKKVKTVDPYNTSKEDHRGLPAGIRKGCRYYTSDGGVFDADWNAAINIALKYPSQHPVSCGVPLDGTLHRLITGRAMSIVQSSIAPNSLIGKPRPSAGVIDGDSLPQTSTLSIHWTFFFSNNDSIFHVIGIPPEPFLPCFLEVWLDDFFRSRKQSELTSSSAASNDTSSTSPIAFFSACDCRNPWNSSGIPLRIFDTRF